MAEKRSNPVERRMTRADSLDSISKYGKIVTPAERDSLPKMYGQNKKKKWKNPLTMLTDALTGKK